MRPNKRVRLPVNDRRAQLMAVASKLFTTRPWDEISVEDIAAAAGISKANFYHYFATKRDLYLALVRAADEDLMARSQQAALLPAKQRLRGGLLSYLDYVEEHAASYTTFLRAGVGSDDAVWDIVESHRLLVMRQVSDSLGVRDVRPALWLALRGWVGFIEALSIAWVKSRSVDRDVVVDLMERNLLASINAAGLADPGSVPQGVLGQLLAADAAHSRVVHGSSRDSVAMDGDHPCSRAHGRAGP
ncbi:MAG: TetR/AcrR family transcriptional regulator [Acidimicrobiales bacterium]